MRRRLSILPFILVQSGSCDTGPDRIHADRREDTGEPVFLPFRMSCYVLTNLVVTAGMLTPGLGVCDILLCDLGFLVHQC